MYKSSTPSQSDREDQKTIAVTETELSKPTRSILWHFLYVCSLFVLAMFYTQMIRLRTSHNEMADLIRAKQLLELQMSNETLPDEGPKNYISLAAGAQVLDHSPTLERLGSSPALVQNSASIVSTSFDQELIAGSCWAFEGNRGYLTVNLSEPIMPTSFAYKHVHQSMNPDPAASSAPRLFHVTAYKSYEDYPVNACIYGYFHFNPRESDDSVQKYDLFTTCHDVRILEFSVTANYGAPYTCLYRLRVFGEPTTTS
ncbi:hypothetical protein QR680_003835 [Steinernema hermaphroditum]|uniref:SUN domain-containing protein n=1 Tax=Steinernema hermaphroditum TaxID=289476 RepID=A0AA39HLQ9_9BILA|nr:hypothetical protein QR680_003835 [Steinernema hermaphroditum]